MWRLVNPASSLTAAASAGMKPFRPMRRAHSTTAPIGSLLCGLCHTQATSQLRWNRVDLDKGVIQVREALEQTKAPGIRFKRPKSKAGRRAVTMPDALIEAMREHRKAALEIRLQMFAGKLPDDALVFADIDGQPLRPNTISPGWASFAEDAGIPDVTFHGLRHTHASQLIDAGVDIVTISKRLGHANPDITLRVYAHLFKKDDRKAAAAINDMVAKR